jgi:hypothetical protein
VGAGPAAGNAAVAEWFTEGRKVSKELQIAGLKEVQESAKARMMLWVVAAVHGGEIVASARTPTPPQGRRPL